MDLAPTVALTSAFLSSCVSSARAYAAIPRTAAMRPAASIDFVGIAPECSSQPCLLQQRCRGARASRRDAGCVTLPTMADLIDNADRARRLARAIASDLTLYNEAKIVQGIQNDSLFDVMKDEIEEGRALYKSRVTPEVFAMNIYERALVDVMLKSKGHIKSKIW
jgi:hypothetical protein